MYNTGMKSDYDFVAIGDITTDAFIRLSDADVHNDKAKRRRELCISYGDKIPYEFVEEIPAVGNCANAAVAAARLGLNSALLTNQGDDEVGKKNLKSLKRDGVSTDLITSHAGKESNYHYVLWFESERTILVKHNQYPYTMPDIGNPKWIYVTSLSQYSLEFHGEIEKYLENHPKIKLAFQPGTFQIKLGYEKLKNFYKRSEAFFCNTQEAMKILNTENNEQRVLLKSIADLGPKIVVITDGPAGAHIYNSYNNEYWFMPIYPDPKPPYERTGAGDAYTSTFTAALAMGHPIETALLWAPINAMSVVQKIGAQAGLLDKKSIEEYLSKAPQEYKPQKI